jgi:transcriptional regulator with XRE-family HTH domain
MFDLVGETLRRLRKERGKTLEQIGRDAQLGRGQLSRIENSRQEATLSTLAKILEAQGVTRREFFRRYDLVEAEALAVHRPAEQDSTLNEPPGTWPQEVQGVISRVEAFLRTTFGDLRPVAQGAIELGEYVVLFRVLPKGSPEALAAEDQEPDPSETGAGNPGKARGPIPVPATRGRGRRGRKRGV